MRLFAENEFVKLQQAVKLLGDVQVEMARANEPEYEWPELYRLRAALGREIHNRRPLKWNEITIQYGEDSQRCGCHLCSAIAHTAISCDVAGQG